jgi:hypothetical protein
MQALCLCSVGQKCALRVRYGGNARCWCAAPAPRWGTQGSWQRVQCRRAALLRPGDFRMTLCPIALAVGCQKCPAFKVCPLKSVIGDQVQKPSAPPAAATKKPKKR